MESREANEVHSRRRMLKGMGAGAAVAWSAPALVSVGGAIAGASPACAGDDWTCGEELVLCGSSGPFGTCVCDVTVEGTTICWEAGRCVDRPACTTSADCAPDRRCASTCCGRVCLPLCGANQQASEDIGPSDIG